MINIYLLLKYNASLCIKKVSKVNNKYVHITIKNDDVKLNVDYEAADFAAFSVEIINALLDEFEKEVKAGK